MSEYNPMKTNTLICNGDGLDTSSLPPKVSEYLEYESAISAFKHEDAAWNSFEEMEAHAAQDSINFARLEILKLQTKIKQMEKIIDTSNRTIRKYKRCTISEESRGRPVRLEDREILAKKFTQR